MNVSPLKSPENLKIEDFGRFKKVRELSGSNIFPTLLITCIEQLIIKKCSNFAFEVFFGLMFEIGEKLEITSLETTKMGLAEFTCALQTKRLKDFRALQGKSEFFEMINEIGEYYNLGNDLKTLKSVQFSLANVKVNVLIRSEFYSRETRRSEANYSTLKVLQRKDGLWLMLENEDFMDDEALENKEKKKQAKFELQKKIEREKKEKQDKEIEDLRVFEENLMRSDEKCRFNFLKTQKDSEKNVREIMSAADLYQKSIYKDQVLSQISFVENFVNNDDEMKKFFKDEKVLKIKQVENMKGLEVDIKKFELKTVKKMKKIRSFLDKSEKEVKWAEIREKELRNYVTKALEIEEIKFKAGKDFEKARICLVRDWVGMEDVRGKKICKEMKSCEAEIASRMMIEENLNHLLNKQVENLNLRSKRKMDCEDEYIKDHTENEITKGRFHQEKVFNEDRIHINYLYKAQKIQDLVKHSLNTSENSRMIFDHKEKKLSEENNKLLISESNFTENFVHSESQIKNSNILKLVKESEIIEGAFVKENIISTNYLQKLAQIDFSTKKRTKKENKCINNVLIQMDNEESLNTQYTQLEQNQALVNSLALSSEDLICKNNNKLQTASELSMIIKMLDQEKQMRKFLKKEKKITKTQKSLLTSEDNQQKFQKLKNQKLQEKIFYFIKKEKTQSKLLKRWEKDLKKLTITDLFSEEKFVKLKIANESLIKKSIQKLLEKEEKSVRLLNRNQKKISEKTLESMIYEERLSKKFEGYLLILEKEEEIKKKADDKYQEALKKIEFQKIAEKQRQARQRQLRIEKDNLRRQSELKKKEEQEVALEANTPSIPPPDLESQVSDDILVQESKIIESLSLICGSYFCTQCYRMLKRSSLFLKCNLCCNSAFKEKITKNSNFTRSKIPENSLCVGCSNVIIKGEIVACICCYIRQDFIKDYSPPCASCSNSNSITWVDTYLGNKYELVNCGFCQRQVNYQYILEICPTCHDQICLHCLRKNNFLANSVCNECHSRRRVNPYRLV